MKKKKSDFFNSIRINDFDKINEFIKMFEEGKIKEEDIPENYRKYIRKSYIQKIQELRAKF